MVLRYGKDKYVQAQEKEEGKKASREEFLCKYRKYVPGKLSKLPPFTIKDWKDAIDKLDRDADLRTSIKQLLISGVSQTNYRNFYFISTQTKAI